MPELVWKGKYTQDDQLTVAPRIVLPFQSVEVISHAPNMTPDSPDALSRDPSKIWHNRLIWGDKKYVLPSLYPEFAGRIKLIYIDPPFTTTTRFIKRNTENLDQLPAKSPSIIERKAYDDTFGQDFDLDKYLQWFYATILLLRDLLSADGSLYVHCDWHISSYIRLVLDEIFGADHHANEIIWHYKSGGRQKNRFSRKHDSIYFYTRSDNWIFNAKKVGEKRGKGKRNNMKKEINEEGHVTYSISSGNKIYRYSEDDFMTPLDVWTDISHIQQKDPQRVGYPTQKPEMLLERIIQASSNKNDIILDCFCGSGTTPVVAEKLERRWIASDISRFAIHTTRERLLQIGSLQPFTIQNIGNYERQIWQGGEDEPAKQSQFAQKQTNYYHFILKLYRAHPLNGFAWLHGIRNGNFVHIGRIDTPVSPKDIQLLLEELWSAYGRDTRHRVDILGWDFTFEIDVAVRQLERENQVKITCKRIPSEILERRVKEEVDINFFELAALDLEISIQQNQQVTITLTDFIASTDASLSQHLHEWHQWIDYWAVDWDYCHDVFHNGAQVYRTAQEQPIETSMNHTYKQPGTYTIAVKVIDILGNDTTTLKEIEVH